MQVDELSLAELQSKMGSGEMTALSLCEEYLERIEKLDRQGPALHSVICVNPDAPAIANALDRERRSGNIRGPLHGIPLLIKDNIDTGDRMPTTAGSLALKGSIALRDAFLVGQLRNAGAVILGKANLSEWANFRGRHSISGWSSLGGLTRNPYALDRTACGSSSGSGAAVAANLCAAAVGTETDGSIVCPSQTNGIVGIKPTLGLVSRDGIIPIAHNQDTAGPMARTVSDAAVLLGALVGADAADKATRAGRTHSVADYTRFLDPAGLRGARIGVARKMAGSNSRVLEILETSLDIIRQLGAVVIDPVDVPNYDKFGDTELEVMYYEFKAGLNKYLAGRGPDCSVRTMEDVIRFNEAHQALVMPYFGQEHMQAARSKGSLKSKKYRAALAKNTGLAGKQGLTAAMTRHRLGALVVPSGGPAWVVDLANGDAHTWDMESTSVPAVAGTPHVTVPAGHIFGLPVGISFLGQAWAEPQLIQYAYAFEQATRARKPPQFLPQVRFDSAA